MEDKVAEVALEVLHNLPSGCQPDPAREWTVFSAIVKEDPEDHFEVVSAGTGTRCLPKSDLNADGVLLHDSHAEIIAVRAFKRYLLHKMKKHLKLPVGTSSDLFDQEGQLRHNIRFHLFTTHPPCGDATIFPVDKNEEEPPRKKTKILDDHSFTGGKLLVTSEGDVLAQDEGAVRTKPGRGDRTLSMSCSDKLAKWLIMGVQGGLLTSLLKTPIYLQSVILAKNSGFQRRSLERALYGRFIGRVSSLPDKGIFQLKVPKIIESSLDFKFSKEDSKSPCPRSLVWCRGGVQEKPWEVAVDGRRQGVARKNIGKPSSRLKICRKEMLKEFLSVYQMKNVEDQELKNFSYREIQEKLCHSYLSFWEEVKKSYFQIWTKKPEALKMFKVDEEIKAKH